MSAASSGVALGRMPGSEKLVWRREMTTKTKRTPPITGMQPVKFLTRKGQLQIQQTWNKSVAITKPLGCIFCKHGRPRKLYNEHKKMWTLCTSIVVQSCHGVVVCALAHNVRVSRILSLRCDYKKEAAEEKESFLKIQKDIHNIFGNLYVKQVKSRSRSRSRCAVTYSKTKNKPLVMRMSPMVRGRTPLWRATIIRPSQ